MKNDLYSSPREVMMLKGDNNFCVPLALSIVSGVDVELVDRILKTTTSVYFRGSRMMRQHKRGVYEQDWASDKLLDQLNIHLEKVYTSASTVSQIERVLNPQYRYLVKVKRHLLSIREGIVQDWTQGRRHRVIAVYRVMRDGQPLTDAVAAPVTPAIVTPAIVAPVVPRAPRIVSTDLLTQMQAMFNDSAYRIKQSGRWVSISYHYGPALKVTQSKGRIVICVSPNDDRALAATVNFTRLAIRKDGTTFAVPSFDELAKIIVA